MPRRKQAPVAPQATEAQIHRAVMDHLRLRGRPGLLYWHTPNEGRRTKAEAGKLKAMGMTAGIPDLVLICDGRTFGLELKRMKGRASPQQVAMVEAFQRAGADAAIVAGVDAALDKLQTWGVLRC
jgi:hypothetical protein